MTLGAVTFLTLLVFFFSTLFVCFLAAALGHQSVSTRDLRFAFFGANLLVALLSLGSLATTAVSLAFGYMAEEPALMVVFLISGLCLFATMIHLGE